MKHLYKILCEENQKAAKYFQNYLFYAKEIKKMAKEMLPDAKLFIFGSLLQQESAPGSDIDILIISSQIPTDLFAQAKIKVSIKTKFPDSPFELHLVTSQQYENWYKGFIKKNYPEIN